LITRRTREHRGRFDAHDGLYDHIDAAKVAGVGGEGDERNI
jgi:hypothetical protein